MATKGPQLSGLIRIEPLDPGQYHLSLDTTLPTLGPLFDLPDLENEASGSSRLLESLKRYETRTHVRRPGSPLHFPKGKEKEAPPEVSKTRSNVWEDVVNLPTARIFQPLKTWDHMPNAGPSASPFLSETKLRLFEALNIIDEEPRSLPKLGEPSTRLSRDSSELLPLLMRSTLGLTTTEELRWNGKAGGFELSTRISSSSLSRSALHSSADRFLSVGTAVRRLEILLDRHGTTPLTPTHHAFLHAVSTCLTYIKSELSSLIEKETRWNGSEVGNVSVLTSILCDLMCWPLSQQKPLPLPSRASYLLTHIHAHLLAHISTSSSHSPQALALAYILQASSAPILALLDRWLGLSPDDSDDTDPSSQQPWSDLGISRKARSHERWEYEFTPRHMPGFIPEESRQSLFEAGKSLRLLREALPGHALCHGSSATSTKWTWDDPAPIGIKEDPRRLGIPTRRKERKPLPELFLQQDSSTSAEVNTEAHDIWSQTGDAPGTHFANGTLWGPTPMDKLESFLAHHATRPLLPFDTPNLPLFILSVILAPLLDHANLLSRTLVTVSLHDLHFLDHLDVLRAFFLAGDVAFTERANVALFGRDSDRIGEALGLGRRARTRARMGLTPARKGHTKRKEESEWGIGLGLGLSERSQWPPGGAELAYALRTTLFDDTRHTENVVWQGIEDRVSFAVRDLPEEKDGERAKWMNPQAIEALDFLYLSYSPDRTIRHLLPSSLMITYQRIHNLLLRIARVETVLSSMYLDHTHRTSTTLHLKTGVDLGSRPSSTTPGDSTDRKSLFGDQPRVEHLVHCLRFRMTSFLTALSRYVLDIAIDKNWQIMRDSLERLKTGDDTVDGSVDGVPALQSIHSLETYHHIIMDRILRSALLFHDSPSQGKVYELLMELFKLALDFGKLLKEVEMGVVEEEEGAEQVLTISASWHKTEEAFIRALERLSQRAQAATDQDTDDMAMLMQHDAGSFSDDLAELHIRLKLGGPTIKRGKWEVDEI